MENYNILVFDIGKTNKKIMIYDQNLELKDESYKSFDEYEEGDVILEDIENASKWLIEQIKTFTSKYNIKAISITTHGASYVTLDGNGDIAVPVIAYTTDPGEEFHNEFYNKFGDPDELQKKTATPNFGALINPGKGIYFMQNKYPEKFKNISKILFYPQYFGFLLTGNYGAEPTYLGCHNYLWDFEKSGYSEVADKLGIKDKLVENISSPWDTLGTIKKDIAEKTGLNDDVIVTFGIHDSNSSLLPYLIKMNEDFILNSTGTWCVEMHPQKTVKFEQDELGKTVFYNLSALSEPVKTTIFMGGLEFETYTKILKEINNRDDFTPFDKDLYQKIIEDQKYFILPSVVKGTGQFPDSKPRAIENDNIFSLEDIQNNTKIPDFFKDYETAYAVLNISLAIQTQVALQRAGAKNGINIYTEGGFRKNDSYNKLITALYPDSNVYLTNLQEATAFGAAILGKCAVDKIEPKSLKDSFEIELNKVEKETLVNFNQYIERWISLV